MSRLAPADVLERDPAVQLVPLPGRRVLVRHRRGESVLVDVDLGELTVLLARVDGRRTAREVAAAAEPVEEARAVGLLRAIFGEAVHARAPAAEGATVPSRPLHVGIVGGGTAGYLAALAIRTRRPGVRVTLIQDPHLPPIGVGEATTPLMPQFLHADLGLGAEELFREVRPTFKLGIRFDWGSAGTGSGGFPYPFGPLRTLEAAAWDGDLDACSIRAVLMGKGVLPVRPGGNGRGALEAAFGTDLAYHLDNRRLAAFLERRAVERGVERVEARIVDVEVAPGAEPEVVSLTAEDGRRFVFDLYVDCSGFRSLLLGEALGSPFVDYGGSLFTDRALVGSVPRAPDEPMPPYTRATTLGAGWSWAIPQPDGDHVGYVYSSAFCGPEAAEEELVALHPGLRAGDGGEGSALRTLRFRAGRRTHFWRGNAVALGNAYGFVEPLESTALHLLIRQIGMLVRHLPEAGAPSGGGERAGLRTRLDREVGEFWDYVRWFLALHFRFNRRLETPFWRACRDTVDVSAYGELIERFRGGGPLVSQGHPGDGEWHYPDPLWGPEGVDTLLLGQGVECRLPTPALSEAEWRERVASQRRLAAGCLGQRELLARLPEHPEVLAALEAGFRARGPAF